MSTSYTLDELLDLEKQFGTYGALLICPAHHYHVEGEIEFEVTPTGAVTIERLKRLTSKCKVCGREMDASPYVRKSREGPNAHGSRKGTAKSKTKSRNTTKGGHHPRTRVQLKP